MYQPYLEWDGFKINGRTFKSKEVAALCRDFGSAQLFDVCLDLELVPSPDNLQTLRNKCQEWENNLL